MRSVPQRPPAPQILTGNRCRCSSCGEHFNSVSVFDRHRVGDWKDRGLHRRCLTVAEMHSRGWALNSAGFWIRKAAQDAREPWHRTRGSGDRPEGGLTPRGELARGAP